MQWTKKTPTTNGFYWVKTDDDHHAKAEIVRVAADETQVETEWDNAVPLVYVGGKSEETGIDQFITDRGHDLKWCGPLIPPE